MIIEALCLDLEDLKQSNSDRKRKTKKKKRVLLPSKRAYWVISTPTPYQLNLILAYNAKQKADGLSKL